MPAQTPLFTWESDTNQTESAQTRAIRELVSEIEQKGQLDARAKVLAETAFSLAANIEAGNRKGRAIANEAAQLIAVMEQLSASTSLSVDDGSQLGEVMDAFAYQP